MPLGYITTDHTVLSYALTAHLTILKFCCLGGKPNNSAMVDFLVITVTTYTTIIIRGKVMKLNVAFFSSKKYDISSFQQHLTQPHWADEYKVSFHAQFFEPRLTLQTSSMAAGFDAVCVFVNDELAEPVLLALYENGVRYIVLRCAGFNNLDFIAAQQIGLRVARVPAYSPQAVAEHTVAMILALNRKLHKAYNRVKEDNFSLQGLLGFNLHGRTAGIIGTGRIGLATARILAGFGMRVLAYDPFPPQQNPDFPLEIVDLEKLYQVSDVISLHCPLMQQTHHMIDNNALAQMKPGVMLVNTSRGGLINTEAVIEHLKIGTIGNLALDVYEQESELFFEDLSGDIIQDDVFQRLLTFPNVLITGHQGFFTEDALTQIAQTTLQNLVCLALDKHCENEIVDS